MLAGRLQLRHALVVAWLLVGLVFGLGYQSRQKVSDITYGTKDEYLRLSTMSDTLLNLRHALVVACLLE